MEKITVVFEQETCFEFFATSIDRAGISSCNIGIRYLGVDSIKISASSRTRFTIVYRNCQHFPHILQKEVGDPFYPT